MKTDGMTEEEINARHAEKMAKKKAARDKIIATKTIEKGLLIVHTGPGKGKSTAAFGLMLRALGRGFRVGVVQFVKGAWETGEKLALARFGDQAFGRIDDDHAWIDRYFHADPHPGNFFVLPGDAIGLIDFGMVGTIDESLRDTLLMDRGESVEIAFVADNPGDWMFHCHILSHQVSGMMGIIRVT